MSLSDFCSMDLPSAIRNSRPSAVATECKTLTVFLYFLGTVSLKLHAWIKKQNKYKNNVRGCAVYLMACLKIRRLLSYSILNTCSYPCLTAVTREITDRLIALQDGLAEGIRESERYRAQEIKTRKKWRTD